MRMQRILALLAALAMLLAPQVAAAASASPTAEHHGSGAMAAHCQSPTESNDDDDRAAGSEASCAALCMQMAIEEANGYDEMHVSPTEATARERRLAAGPSPEIATPPPRSVLRLT
jgi:hypothetical protein